MGCRYGSSSRGPMLAWATRTQVRFVYKARSKYSIGFKENHPLGQLSRLPFLRPCEPRCAGSWTTDTTVCLVLWLVPWAGKQPGFELFDFPTVLFALSVPPYPFSENCTSYNVSLSFDMVPKHASVTE